MDEHPVVLTGFDKVQVGDESVAHQLSNDPHQFFLKVSRNTLANEFCKFVIGQNNTEVSSERKVECGKLRVEGGFQLAIAKHGIHVLIQQIRHGFSSRWGKAFLFFVINRFFVSFFILIRLNFFQRNLMFHHPLNKILT